MQVRTITIAIAIAIAKIIAIIGLLFGGPAYSADEEQTTALNDNPQHEQGVQLAREGKPREGLAILQKLIEKDPGNYAVRRDMVIIATWADDCALALKHYEKIKNVQDQEAYLLVPVSECLAEQDRLADAIKLLKKGAEQWPEDEELAQKLEELEKQNRSQTAPLLSVSIANNNSDQGNVEWLLETRYSRQVLSDTRAYARFLAARADDPEFATGDLNRLGAGVTHHLNDKITLDLELSTDVKDGGEEGITGTLVYQPRELWELGAQHATFSEDLPLRAKAADITSDRTNGYADFHTEDYRWTWSASASHYEFSDNNTRESFSTAASYAYYLEPSLEHRVIVDLSKSSNSLPGTDVVYFNPSHDTGITLTHKTSIVYDSRFQRHVDHLSVFLGSYEQQHFAQKPVYGLEVQQEYTLSDFIFVSWGAGYASRVYDGNREQEFSVFAAYEQKF